MIKNMIEWKDDNGKRWRIEGPAGSASLLAHGLPSSLTDKVRDTLKETP